MKAERIHNLWGPADRAPAPADLILVIARGGTFEADVLIALSGNVQRTRHTAALAYLEEVYRAFCSIVKPTVEVPFPAGRANLNRAQATLTLFECVRISFAFDENGLCGRAPTHFYRGLP